MTDTPTTTRRVASLALGRVGSRAVSSAALGITLLLIARGTTVADFGHLMTAYTAGLIVGLAVGLGAPTRILRLDAEHPDLPGTLFVVHSLLVVSAAVIALAVATVTGAGWVVVAGIVFALGDTMQNYAQAHLTARDRQLAANVLVTSHRLIPLAVVVVALVVDGRVGFVLLTTVCVVPIVIGLLAPLSDASRRSAQMWSAARQGASGYWVYALAAMLPQIQIPVLALIASPVVVGQFSMATRVIGPVTLLTASMSAVLVPELARRISDRGAFDALYAFSVRISAVYLVVVAALAWPGALVVTLLAGPQYREATFLVFAMIVSAGIGAFAQASNSKLLALGRAGSSARALIAGGVVGLILLVAVGATAPGGWLWTVPVATQMLILGTMLHYARAASPARDLSTSGAPR
ncbi:lipopolysaccharide biosynthesis protein [Williamsia sp. MIQD14]|uniref:lipopolysaccharide biosynthesis protein n=1 Tax=Williamsia sp. MIQD14 TaxID=3425703 RepID=UPI003DA158BA